MPASNKTELIRRSNSLILTLALLSGCVAQDEPSGLSGPYFGQSPPGGEPRLFMPGLVSTNEIDHCVGFLEGGRVCVFSIRDRGTYSMFEKDGRWSRPEAVPWKNERGATDFTVGPDGRTVYFQSYRPTAPDDEVSEGNTWVVEWTEEGWAEPVPLPPPANTDEYSEWYPSAAPDGTVYFFSTSRPDSENGDIFRSRLKNGAYGEAERLPAPVNGEYYEVDPVISPDGRYLLFGSGRPGGYGLLDLYVSFVTEDGGWTAPVNAGPDLNPFSIPTRMSVTPDGRYFFFPSRCETDVWKGEEIASSDIDRWGDVDVYWVDTSFVENREAELTGRESAASVVEQVYRRRGIDSAVSALARLCGEERNDHYFEVSEFMALLEEMLRADRRADAEELTEALLNALPDEFRIRQGYALACIMSGWTAEGLELLDHVWAQHPSRRPTDEFMIPFQLGMMGRTEDQLAALRFLASERPESGFAHFDLAVALEREGHVGEALFHCRRALELRPSLQDAADMLERLEPS